MRRILCNNCYRTLTERELKAYSLQWQYSSDMYCARCRNCVDDCRETPCRKDRAMQAEQARIFISDFRKRHYHLTDQEFKTFLSR